MRFLFVLLALCLSLNYFYQQSYRACSACKWNQKNYAVFLSVWAMDHRGTYPDSLDQLRGDYLKQLPTCPASGRPPDYRRGRNYFALACLGENHPGLLPASCPAYTSTRGPLGWNGPESARPRLSWVSWLPFALLIPLSHRRILPLLLSCLLLLPAQARSQGPVSACQSNLKNLATALEMWSSDHRGRYPKRLDQLVPTYLREIPRCPVAHHDTYSHNYRSWSNPDDYILCCTGAHHVAVLGGPNLPAYTAEAGLISWGANLKSPALCEEPLHEVSRALLAYQRKWGVYPRHLWQLKPHYLTSLPRCSGGDLVYHGQGRVSCPMEAHLAWDLSYFEPSWSPEEGLTHRKLREDVSLPRPVRENNLPLVWTLCLLVILASCARRAVPAPASPPPGLRRGPAPTFPAARPS